MSQTIMTILLLQGSLAMSDTIIMGILALIVSAVTGWLTSKVGAAEWKGACNQKFANIETKFSEIDQDQNAQWKDINRANNGVSKLEGQALRRRT